VRRWSFVLALAVAIAVAAGCKKQKRRGADPTASRAPGPREPTPAELPPCQGNDCLPDLALDGHDGSHIETAALRGKVVVVVVCAVWAGPCGPMAKTLSEVQERHQGRGLTSVMLMINEGLVDDLERWGRLHATTVPMVPADEALLKRFGRVSVVPTALLYGRDGHLILFKTATEDDLWEAVRRALDAPFVGPGAATR